MLKRVLILLSFYLITTAPSALAFTPQNIPPGTDFRPLPKNNARGKLPNIPPPIQSQGYGTPQQNPQMPNWPPYQSKGRSPYFGQGQPQMMQSSAPARLEGTISTNQAYVYQNLVLTLEVISGQNLSTLNFTLPQSDAFIFKVLGERTAEARTTGRQREIVTKQQYLIIPLRQGSYNLDELVAEGTYASQQAGSFELRLPQRIQLLIEPPKPDVIPWLPLDSLKLNATLSNEENLELGQPANLMLEMSAIGTTGGQLPSLEKQLKSEGLRIYREKTEHTGTLKADGKLHGTRTEYYTLLPGKEARLSLPSIQVRWWNLRKSRAETTLLPMRMLGVNAGKKRSISFDDIGLFPAGNSWVFWMPLLAIAFFTGLYWSFLWARGKSFGQRYSKHIAAATAPARKFMVFWAYKLSLRRQMHRLRRFIADSLPRSWRLWYCVRVADNEDDPAVWLQVLRFLVERRLGIPSQTSLPRLADHIVRLHPGADAPRVTNMLRQLEAAMFGNKPLKDFADWKKRFKREIRPRLLPSLVFPEKGVQQQGLPSLNP